MSRARNNRHSLTGLKNITAYLLLFLLLLAGTQAPAKVRQDPGNEQEQKQKRKVLQGFDGGMMVHAGYLRGTLEQIGYDAKGVPVGLGGVLRLHLGRHFRIGGEGYVSTLNQMKNGSKLKYGWGGILADAYMNIGRLRPYVGVTVGGGAMTTLLMTEQPQNDWAQIDGTYYHKQGFLAVDPFIGFDIAVIGPMRITLKADYLLPVTSGFEMLPHGPRVYFGFIFSH